MVSYYKRLMANVERSQALRQTQLEMLQNPTVPTSLLLGCFYPLWRLDGDTVASRWRHRVSMPLADEHAENGSAVERLTYTDYPPSPGCF
jgi:CHAT domain-containing protein